MFVYAMKDKNKIKKIKLILILKIIFKPKFVYFTILIFLVKNHETILYLN
jgi:hypothetical protein